MWGGRGGVFESHWVWSCHAPYIWYPHPLNMPRPPSQHATPTHHAYGIGGVCIVPIRVPVHAHPPTAELDEGAPGVLLLLSRAALTGPSVQTHMVLAVYGLQLCQRRLSSTQTLQGQQYIAQVNRQAVKFVSPCILSDHSPLCGRSHLTGLCDLVK